MVYPNPASSFLIVEADVEQIRRLSYQFLEMNGKLLKQGKMTANKTKISINDLAGTLYFLKISDNNKAVKAFKILKNQ